MKQVGEALNNHLNQSKTFLSCDLYGLHLKSGLSYYWADTDVNVTYGGNVYRGDGPVITRNKTSTRSEVSVDKLTISISCDKKDTIGGVPLMAVAHNGGLDGSTLNLKRAFFTAEGVLIDAVDLFTGIVEVRQGGGLTLQLDIKSVVQKLNVDFPNKRYYPQCPYCIYSSECGVKIEQYRKRVKVTAVTGTNTIAVNTTFADGYYNAGGIEWLSGPLAGQSTQIMSSAANWIIYMSPSNTQPVAGNEAYVYPGCDKTPETCRSKFNNFLRNRATPYVPLKETIR
ncbi:DUF2163 domain-containing protein [Colibacter massiliensis]|uniref:DUF2163 domain-containing protein n=1 Tax=Colibacter massiliensis TaxID=1852379 RepID=UPI003F914303